ncbi:MAG TPA: S-methyl-5'-thioadenosine phosphorylase [Myxococcaceae bacterium]|nr:S-methyl-5'-thioadenosine phosphorylase [Myxococcaceae bacterium]
MATTSEPIIGIIGGSGLGQALSALGGEAVEVDTPFGKPSGPIFLAKVGDQKVAALSRHGKGHRFNPSQVPYRANVWALKSVGATQVLASAAVGSLKQEIAPRDLVVCDQVIDKTFRRPSTFFDDIAVHVELAAPFCPRLRAALVEAGRKSGHTVHEQGTYVCMEGPQFSTRAESELHRSWGADLIGMTVMPEAKLAREAELCYALVALPTDYDCWQPHAPKDQGELLKEIIGNLQVATDRGLNLMRQTLPRLAPGAQGLPECHCQSALALGIWSDKALIPAAEKQRLGLLLGKYL